MWPSCKLIIVGCVYEGFPGQRPFWEPTMKDGGVTSAQVLFYKNTREKAFSIKMGISERQDDRFAKLGDG